MKPRRKKTLISVVGLTCLLIGNYALFPLQAVANETSTTQTTETYDPDATISSLAEEEPTQQQPTDRQPIKPIEEQPTETTSQEAASQEDISSVTEAAQEDTEKQELRRAPRQSDWQYNVTNGVAHITDYTGDPTDIIVPSEIDGKPVQIDLEGVLGAKLESQTTSFAIESSKQNLPPVKVVGTFRGLFADVGQGGISGASPIQSANFGDADTSAITDMSYMFANCTSLPNLDLSGLDTQNVENMSSMFENCGNLTNLNVDSLNTSNVMNTYSMFYSCSSLVSLNLSSFDTQNVTDMSAMFYGCYSLINVDLSSFDTQNVTNMTLMFYRCNSLEAPNLSSFDTQNVISMLGMFYGCNNLTNLNLSSFNTSNVTDMESMFYGCSNLTNLNLDYFDTSKVTNMRRMFNDCNNLSTLTLNKEFKFKDYHELRDLPAAENNGKTTFHWVKDDYDETYNSTEDFIANHHLTEDSVSTYTIQKKHSVTFDTNGGSGSVTPQQVFENTKAVNPNYTGTNTGKPHHHFGGWRLNGNIFDFTTPVTAPMTLTANWAIDTYTVRFHANNGKAETADQTFDYDEKKKLTPNAFSKAGYTFKEWNTTDDGKGNAYPDQAEVKNLSSTNEAVYPLYAQWQANDYSIIFNGNGGEGELASLELLYDQEKNLTKNTISRKGYQFTGWNTRQDGKGNSYGDEAPVKNLTAEEKGKVTLFAQWQAINYTVTFDSNGGSDVNQETYTIEKGIDFFPMPTKSGYKFLGWFDEDENKIESIPKNETGDRILKAKWETIPYDVTFDSSGGADVEPKTYTIEKGIGSFPTPTKLGYTFLGWYDEDGAKTEAIPDGKTGDRKLTARWKLIDYTITFDDPAIAAIPYTIESDPIKLPVKTKTGYTFLGWLVSEDTLSRKVTDSGKIVQEIKTGSTGNLMLSAQWQANPYTIRFDSNGGAGEMTTQLMTYDEAAKLSANAFTRSGYIFVNWNTQADGKGTSYTDTQEIWNLVASGELTLYAQWKPVKTVLDDLITKEKETNRNKEDYTEDSWKVYEEALKKAEKVLADPQATSEEIATALTELKQAIANLKSVKKPGGVAIGTSNTMTGTRKTYPTSYAKAKSYPRAGIVTGSGLTIIGLAAVGSALAGWKKRKGK